jgi:hypothetical protein
MDHRERAERLFDAMLVGELREDGIQAIISTLEEIELEVRANQLTELVAEVEVIKRHTDEKLDQLFSEGFFTTERA